MEKRGKKCIPFRAAFAAVSALGCLFHFLYRISGSNPAVGLFTSVSESTWEHMKLLFFPMVLYIIIQWILCGRSSSGYLPAMTKGLLLGLCFIPTAFYTYTGVLGRNHFIADILIFFISVWLSIRTGEKQLQKYPYAGHALNISAIIILLCLTAMFIGFTYSPPYAPIFISPV